MSNCPYCKLEIAKDAIKCPHCLSSLVSPAERTDDDSAKVVYVVDRGLIHFGKFAAAIIAIFALIGVFFFGFSIEQASDIITSSKLEVITAKLEVDQAKLEINRTKKDVAELKAEITEYINTEIKPAVSEIEKSQAQSSVILEPDRERVE